MQDPYISLKPAPKAQVNEPDSDGDMFEVPEQSHNSPMVTVEIIYGALCKQPQQTCVASKKYL